MQFEVCSQRATGSPVTCCCPYQGAKVAKAYTAKVYTDPSPPKYTDNTQARPGHDSAMCVFSTKKRADVCMRQHFTCSSVSCATTAAKCNEKGGTTAFC